MTVRVTWAPNATVELLIAGEAVTASVAIVGIICAGAATANRQSGTLLVIRGRNRICDRWNHQQSRLAGRDIEQRNR
jgi:hypothetical protein